MAGCRAEIETRVELEPADSGEGCCIDIGNEEEPEKEKEACNWMMRQGAQVEVTPPLSTPLVSMRIAPSRTV